VAREEKSGRLVRDTIGLRDEDLDGRPLLSLVMKQGQRTNGPESLGVIRDRFQRDFAALDPACKALEHPSPYPVELGSGLMKLQDDVIHEVIEKELGES
jgi:hypothetical protein